MCFRQIEACAEDVHHGASEHWYGRVSRVCVFVKSRHYTAAQSHMAQTRRCRDVRADTPMMRRLKSGHRTAEQSEYAFSSNRGITRRRQERHTNRAHRQTFTCTVAHGTDARMQRCACRRADGAPLEIRASYGRAFRICVFVKLRHYTATAGTPHQPRTQTQALTL